MLTWSSKHGASYGTPMTGPPPRSPPRRGEKLSQERQQWMVRGVVLCGCNRNHSAAPEHPTTASGSI